MIVNDVKSHRCPICHNPTDCPDLCASCARLRSKPIDWTDHPQHDPTHAYAGTPDPDAICNRCGSLGYLVDETCSLNRCPGTMVALATDLVAALAKALDDLDETTYGEVPDVVAAVRDAAQALIVDLREKAGA